MPPWAMVGSVVEPTGERFHDLHARVVMRTDRTLRQGSYRFTLTQRQIHSDEATVSERGIIEISALSETAILLRFLHNAESLLE